jgi:competence transcription factor ComK
MAKPGTVCPTASQEQNQGFMAVTYLRIKNEKGLGFQHSSVSFQAFLSLQFSEALRSLTQRLLFDYITYYDKYYYTKYYYGKRMKSATR